MGTHPIFESDFDCLTDMITPVFRIKQVPDFIIIDITAKYSKPSSAEILVDEELFVFNSKPFYLRLRFSNKLTNIEENIKSQYDIDTGVYTIQVPKLHPGEEFKDLDLIK